MMTVLTFTQGYPQLLFHSLLSLITVISSLYLTVFGYISHHTLQCYHTGLLVKSHGEIILTCIFLALLHF